jgi:SagB-type dehydrogenase family enzyme
MSDIDKNRIFLKADWAELGRTNTDQKQRKPYPSLSKPYPEGAELISLPALEQLSLGAMPLATAIANRESRRKFSNQDITLAELTFLLWATQGVRRVAPSGGAALRTVPSGGARHTFETYLACMHVGDLTPGVYRYLPFEHKLLMVAQVPDVSECTRLACNNQRMAGQSAVCFCWSTVPYRAEWRYATQAHKMIAIDAGHVCQNLYLACESLGLGCCAIGAYDQQLVDELIGVDGQDEFSVYLAAIGKIA